MSKIKNLRNWLQGKKTYIVCLGAMIASAILFIDGSIELPELVKQLIALVIGVTIRAGVSTESKTTEN